MTKHRIFNVCSLLAIIACLFVLIWMPAPSVDYVSAAAQQAAQEQAAALRKEKAEVAINNEGSK